MDDTDLGLVPAGPGSSTNTLASIEASRSDAATVYLVSAATARAATSMGQMVGSAVAQTSMHYVPAGTSA